MQFSTTTFKPNQQVPLYQQIFIKIQGDMRSGILKKQDRLPSIREAMRLFHTSKTTIENAYAKLVAEGYVKALPKKGYFVDVDKEDIEKRDFIFCKPTQPSHSILYNLSSDAIDEHSFDVVIWKRYMKEAMEDKKSLATYGDVQGELVLRKAIQKYIYTQRGIVCDVNHIIMGANYQSLLYLLMSLFDEPQHIAMEEDCFSQAYQVFQDAKLPVTHIARIQEGIDVAALQTSKANMVYLQSSATGLARQQLGYDQSLLAWCHQQHWMIEDDHNGELRYTSHVRPALKGFDKQDRIIYISSFSKILLPSLRIAYMILPQALYERYVVKKAYYSPSASKIEQLALATYIAQGKIDRHIKKVRKQYEYKYHLMKQYIDCYLKGYEYYLDEASFQFVVAYDQSLPQLKQALLEKQIKIEIKNNAFLLSFSALEISDMEKVLKMIQQTLQSLLY